MENANNISYVLQLMDSCSDRGGKSSISNADYLASESLYKFLASDLAAALLCALQTIKGKSQEDPKFRTLFLTQLQQNQLPLIYKTKLVSGEISPSSVVQILEEMVSVLDKLGNSKISFTTESELISIFQIIFSETLFDAEVFCLISSMVHRAIKETALANWKEVHYALFTNLLLLQYGTCQYIKYIGYKICSADMEDYPLHKAVYENQISDLIELLYNSSSGNYFYLGLEDCDPLGNTPLTLAVKIQNIEAIVILLEYCADPSNQPSHRCMV